MCTFHLAITSLQAETWTSVIKNREDTQKFPLRVSGTAGIGCYFSELLDSMGMF